MPEMMPGAMPGPGPATGRSQRRPLKPRTLRLRLAEEQIPRHWFAGNGFVTALANSLNLLFPAGERFFVRSVRHFLPQLTDEDLRQRVQGFGGQEGRHAQAHERYFQVMREQGYDVDGFLEIYELVGYRLVERLMTPALRLSSTAACEHFTAILAEGVLRYPVLSLAHPAMAQILQWHAAEEIEHKSVCFDVLSTVNPSYALRIAGLAIAATMLGACWLGGMVSILRQDRRAGLLTLREDLRRVRTWRRANQRRGVLIEVFVRGIREYLRRDFHPSQMPNDHLAEAYLAGAGIL